MAESSTFVQSTAEPKSSRYTIRVLAKALDLLHVLAQSETDLPLAELSRELGLPKSSVFRYLATLEERGYVQRSSTTDGYRLGLKLFELGSRVAAQFNVREEALPQMRYLLETFRETVNLGILHDGEVIYLEILESTRAIRMAAQPGQRDLTHCTALGKAMLAYLPAPEVEAILARHGMPALTAQTVTTVDALTAELDRVRRVGYAEDVGENESGVRCVGAPVFNHQGAVVAALSVSGPASRLSTTEVEAIGKELVRVTGAISRRLGYSGTPQR